SIENAYKIFGELLKSAAANKPAKAAPAPENPPESDESPAVEVTKAQEPRRPSLPTDGKKPQESTAPTGRVLISPIAARMAAEAGIDLKSLRGSGPGGRIVKSDVEAAKTQKPAAPVPELAP